MHLVRSLGPLGAALALAFVSCNPGDGVAPPPRPTLQADLLVATALPAVRISEIHYDNTGTDAGEAIEISGPAGTDLTGWSVVLYNGSGGAPYNTLVLNGIISDQCGDGRGTLSLAAAGLQNGAPDGMALVSPTGVQEFLSYEGTFTAVGGPANGLVSTDVGLDQDPAPPIGQSLQRTANGNGWYGPAASTFGACNVDPTVVTVTVTPATATVSAGASQQFTAAAADAAGQPVAITFIWTSTAPSVADVSTTGSATGRTPGDARIVATAPIGVAADTAALRVTAAPPPVGLPETRFAELHYDNEGTDIAEAIEIEGPAGADLDGWVVVLYNGSGGAVYDTRALGGTIVARCAGRGVVRLTYPSNGIQNGGPDGLALVDAAGAVVEFLSYEGTFTAADGPAAGLISTDIGVAEGSSTPLGRSLHRLSTGVWQPPAQATFGACNEGDAGPPPPPVLTMIFTGRTASDPALPVGFQDQLFATLVDATRTVVPTAFTWTSDRPEVADVDQDGVVTALGAGTAILRVTSAEGTATFSLPTRIAVASATALYAGNTEFGVPADGDPSDDFIVLRSQYTASYNRNRGTPNWVSYDLEVTHFGPEDRCDCFTFDPALPAAFTHYTTADYTGAGAFHGYGIDRGHLARSFDRTSASLDNATTFYFTNIIPQAADLNQGPWADLEVHLGDLARLSNREVYIVAGVAGSKGTVKDEGTITIPASVWKVALILPRDSGLASVHSYADVEVIAVIMPNDPGVRDVEWATYRTTVNAVEGLSGYELLALLPDDIEATLESGIHTVQTLIDGLVVEGTLKSGAATSLTAKLRAAAQQFERGNVTAGVNQLGSFLNELDALVRSGRLAAAEAEPLRAAAGEVMASASGGP